jgi:murein DD-endopeptidase MepM/ murein hydrolase activator NlpD
MTDKIVSHAIERGIYFLFANRGFAETSRAAGNHLIVDMGNSQYALYVHLKPYSVTLQMGDVVTEGQKLGLLGNTGNTSGPHLHFQVMDRPSALKTNGLPLKPRGQT